MTKQVALDRFKEPLLKLLDETFSTTHGLFLDRGTSLFDTLQSVSAEEASLSGSPGTATVAAQVDHLRFYLDVLVQIIKTKELVKVDWRDIWQRVGKVTPEQWELIKTELRQSHQRLLETIQSFEDWDGEYDLSGPLCIVAHTAYHLGGIRQTLGVIRTRNTTQSH